MFSKWFLLMVCSFSIAAVLMIACDNGPEISSDDSSPGGFWKLTIIKSADPILPMGPSTGGGTGEVPCCNGSITVPSFFLYGDSWTPSMSSFSYSVSIGHILTYAYSQNGQVVARGHNVPFLGTQTITHSMTANVPGATAYEWKLGDTVISNTSSCSFQTTGTTSLNFSSLKRVSLKVTNDNEEYAS